MQGRTTIIFAILVVYIATGILARRYYDISEEDDSLELRRADLMRLLRRAQADKRRVHFGDM
jgi:hypothetical protein